MTRQAIPVAAVVVSHNSAEDLPSCLAGLCEAEAVASIVVVDNCSSDDSATVVHACPDPRVRLLKLEHNTGYAGGCNHGLAAVDPAIPVIAFLNPDVTVTAGCLSRCSRALVEDATLAGVAPRLMRPDGRVDSVGQVLHPLTLEVRDRGYGQPASQELLEQRPVLAACGALAVYRRSALDGLSLSDDGPWATSFFCFWEDLELGWRLRNGGWRIISLPQAVARHGRGAGAETGRGPLRWRRPPQLEACVITNRWMTLLRHLHPLDLLWRLPLLLGWDLATAVVSIARRPVLCTHLVARLPLVARQLRVRRELPQQRLRTLL